MALLFRVTNHVLEMMLVNNRLLCDIDGHYALTLWFLVVLNFICPSLCCVDCDFRLKVRSVLKGSSLIYRCAHESGSLLIHKEITKQYLTSLTSKVSFISETWEFLNNQLQQMLCWIVAFFQTHHKWPCEKMVWSEIFTATVCSKVFQANDLCVNTELESGCFRDR
jgi:hypothetical protein